MLIEGEGYGGTGGSIRGSGSENSKLMLNITSTVVEGAISDLLRSYPQIFLTALLMIH